MKTRLSFRCESSYPEWVRALLVGFFSALHDFLKRPLLVLGTCLLLAFSNLVLDGTLFRLWSLDRERQQLLESSQNLKTDLSRIGAKIREAKEPSFVEREARDRLDLVSEGDLVFLFSDEEE